MLCSFRPAKLEIVLSRRAGCCPFNSRWSLFQNNQFYHRVVPASKTWVEKVTVAITNRKTCRSIRSSVSSRPNILDPDRRCNETFGASTCEKDSVLHSGGSENQEFETPLGVTISFWSPVGYRGPWPSTSMDPVVGSDDTLTTICVNVDFQRYDNFAIFDGQIKWLAYCPS